MLVFKKISKISQILGNKGNFPNDWVFGKFPIIDKDRIYAQDNISQLNRFKCTDREVLNIFQLINYMGWLCTLAVQMSLSTCGVHEFYRERDI